MQGAAAAAGQSEHQCRGLVKNAAATRVAGETASPEWGSAGRSAGRARVTQPRRPMNTVPRGASGQSEARRFVSDIKRGRERDSPGVKLKLNPVRYKEVTGGRFRLPIRNMPAL